MDLTKSWGDLVAFLAGAVSVLATFVWARDAASAEQPLLVLGALLAVSALWSLLGAGGASSWVTEAFGALLVLSPWAFAFDGSGSAAWTAWIAGGVTVIVGLWKALQTRSSGSSTLAHA